MPIMPPRRLHRGTFVIVAVTIACLTGGLFAAFQPLTSVAQEPLAPTPSASPSTPSPSPTRARPKPIPTPSVAPSSGEPVPSLAMGVQGGGFTIENPDACDARIGAGGNLREAGALVEGKCQGAGLSPRAIGRGSQALSFSTDPDFRYPGAVVRDASKNTWQDAAGRTLRDRSEIATPWELPFGTDVWVGFDLRIPSGVDDVTGSGAYVLQLWQCTSSPIGGVRIQATPGGSHNVQFVRRGDAPGVAYNTSMATERLTPDAWESFVIRYRVVPYTPGGPTGKIEVYHRGPGAKGADEKLVDSADYFGYSDPSRCSEDNYDTKFRIKFGIYKDYQPGSTFRADLRNVRIGGTKAEVQPYNRAESITR